MSVVGICEYILGFVSVRTIFPNKDKSFSGYAKIYQQLLVCGQRKSWLGY